MRRVDVHPWHAGTWVVTVDGKVVSEPMTLERAEREADRIARTIVGGYRPRRDR